MSINEINKLKIVCNVGKQVQLKELNEKLIKIFQSLDDNTPISLSVNTDDTLDEKEIKIELIEK